MVKISGFTDFLGESESTINHNFEEIGQEDMDGIIEEIISSGDFREYVGEFISQRSLEIDEINYDDDTNFWITYESNRMDGSIPNRITIYMDELCKKLESDWFGVGVDWWFGKNGNCNLVNFNLEEVPDIKWIRSKKLLKYI
jgi:hypothetical protein